jgi:hypothetical protein
MKKNIRIKEEEAGGEGDESFYHKPRYLVVMMKSKRKRWVQHIVYMGKGEKYFWNVNFKLQGKRPFKRIIFRWIFKEIECDNKDYIYLTLDQVHW